jgi:hypothetical protein
MDGLYHRPTMSKESNVTDIALTSSEIKKEAKIMGKPEPTNTPIDFIERMALVHILFQGLSSIVGFGSEQNDKYDSGHYG